MGDLATNLSMFVAECSASTECAQQKLGTAVCLLKLGVDEFPPHLREEWAEIQKLLMADGSMSLRAAAWKMSDEEASALIERIARLSRRLEQWENLGAVPGPVN